MQSRDLIVFLIFGLAHVTAYKIPPIKLDRLQDGFRVSIPDEIGVKNVAFNINRNRPFKSFEQGEYSAQVYIPIDNRWMLEVKRPLEDNDILYVWINVQHNQLVYRFTAQTIPVMGEAPKPDINSNSPTEGPDDSNEFTTCEKSITIVEHRNACKDELIFEETFDGRELNSSAWKQEVRLPLDIGDSEFVLYNDIARVSGGYLSIVPKHWNNDKPGTDIKQGFLDLGQRCTGIRGKECTRQPNGRVTNVLPPAISGRINTKNSFNFKYGRIEIRAKLPMGDWLVPLLLLEPVTPYYGHGAYESGQLRIAFARGNKNLLTRNDMNIDGSTLYGGAVVTSGADSRENFMVNTRGSDHFGEDFHVYTMIWTDQMLTMKVDGQEYGHVDGGFSNINSPRSWISGGHMAPFDREFYITLGVSVGGHGDFPDLSVSNNHPKPWENTSPKAAFSFWRNRDQWKSTWNTPQVGLEVDYVRVYAI